MRNRSKKRSKQEASINLNCRAEPSQVYLFQIESPQKSCLWVPKHDIGDVEVSNIVGNVNITARIGDVIIRLPASEEFNVDARARIGDVSSEFGGKNSQQWLIGAKANQATDYKETAHWVIARIGIGDIEVLSRLFFWSSTGWSMKGGNLLANDWILRSFVNIYLSPMLILLGHVGVREDRFDRTLRHAGIAIDAGLSVDVEAVRQFMECLDRANCCAIGVLAINT